MSQGKARDTLGQRNTRKHWALYALDKWEAENGRRDGATAEDIYTMVGGEDSRVFTSRADAGAALRAAFDAGFTQRRTVEGEWDGPELIAYRLTETGHDALRDASKPTKLPNRREEGYSRDVPAPPAHEIRGRL